MFISTAESINAPERHSTTRTILDALESCGWCVVPDFMTGTETGRLRHHALSGLEAQDFRPAGIGRGSGGEVNPARRSDLIHWIDTQDAGFRQLCGERLEALRLAINAHLFLGLFDLETHFAIYRPGAFYEKHLDQFRDAGRRKLTIVLYLNRKWTANDGGELLLYTQDTDDSQPVTILPQGGTLVCFLSEVFPHEVLPAGRDRLSLTGWFRTRETG
jgi:SM-20-related protein